MPRLTEHGLSGFKPSGKQGPRDLALMMEGTFDSYFAGKPSPLLEQPESEQGKDAKDGKDDKAATPAASTEDKLGVVTSVIEHSPESARLFVFGSNDFLADNVLQLIGSAEGSIYGNSIQLMANAVDYSLEDRNLLEIRSRGHFNRTLPPMKPQREVGMESVNYGLALSGVVPGVPAAPAAGQARREPLPFLAGGGLGMSGRVGILEHPAGGAVRRHRRVSCSTGNGYGRAQSGAFLHFDAAKVTRDTHHRRQGRRLAAGAEPG